MLIWVDIETTGLDPSVDELLEVGMIVTYDDLDEVYRKSWVIRHKSFRFNTPFVAKMHAGSGLLDECYEDYDRIRKNNIGLYDLRSEVFNFLRECEEKSAETVFGSPMAGASVHFDREFLKVKEPGLMKYFSYRNLDVSTIGRLAETWRPDLKDEAPKKRDIHRALPDLEDSIEALRFYKKNWLT